MPTKPIQPADELTPESVSTSETGAYQYDDEAATRLVLDAVSMGDAWMTEENWPAAWSNCYDLYQSPASISCFDGGGNGSAHVPNYTVSNLCDATVPKIIGGLFYEQPYFLLRPRPATTQAMVDMKTALFAYQLDDMGFEEEVELTILQGALIGTMVMKYGWTEHTEKNEVFKRRKEPDQIKNKVSGITHTIHTEESDAFDIEYEEKLISRPWIKFCDRRHLLVNRGCRVGDIRKAKDVVYRDYPTYDDLNLLREMPGYTVPEESELKEWYMRPKGTPGPDTIAVTIPESMRGWIQTAVPRNYKGSADPLQTGLEMYEYWSKDRLIVVLNHAEDNILLYNGANPYNRIPFLSACWRPIPNCFDGQGIGLLTGSNQLVSQGITDMSLSLLDYNLNPVVLRSQGFNTPSQDIIWTQGGILDVEGNVNEGFKVFELPETPSSAMQWLMQQQAEAKETAGANQQMSLGAGAPGIQTTGTRSGTGAAGVISANASRLDGPIGRFVRQIFVPWLGIMDELNNKRLPSSILRSLLSEQMGKQVDVDHIEFRSAKIQYEVLAGAKLGARKEMEQFYTFVVQMLNNPTFMEMISEQDNTLDATAIFNQFAASAGWKYSQQFLIPQTPAMKQRRAQNSPAAIQQVKGAQAKAASLQKFQQNVEEDAEKQLNKAGGEVTRNTIEHAMSADPMAQPIGQETGF